MFVHKRVTAILGVALTLANAMVPAWAEDRAYFRLKAGTGAASNGSSPDIQDNTVRGTGDLAVFGPTQVRARPGVPFSLRFPVTQASVPVTWSLQGTPLPAGLSLDPSGTIVGSPAAVGEARGVLVTATDADGRTGTTQPFTVTVAPLPVVTVSGAFTFPSGRPAGITPTASNLYGSRTWTLHGALPIGLSLDPLTGAIAGTPEQKGAFPGLRIGVTDSDGAQGLSAPFSIAVETDLNLYGLQAAYAARLGKPIRTVRPYLTGTTNAVKWSLVSSDGTATPSGLSIDEATGALSGTPSQGGTYRGLSVRALDTVTGDRIASPPFTLTVAGAPSASAGNSYFGRVGQSLTIQPSASNVLGGGRWMLDGGDLPNGLTLNPDSGRISGTLATTGAGGDLSLRVIDLLDGASASTQPFAIQSWPKLEVQTAGIPLAQVGRAFRMAAPTVQGLRGAMSLTLSGTLPSGLSFDRNTGEIAGVPDKAGPSGLLAYGVTDAGDDMSAASPMFSFDVLAADVPVPFAVTGISSTLQAKAGQPFDYQPSATGAKGTVTWTLGGVVPAWLGVASATGRLTGTPPAAGMWEGFSYTARDASTGKTAPSNAFAISAAPADLLSIRLSPSYSTQVGAAASDVRPDIQNASGATTFALASGTLPPGTQIDAATGTLTGNTTESGTFDGLVMSVADASGARSTSNAFTVSVLPAPASANAATASLFSCAARDGT